MTDGAATPVVLLHGVGLDRTMWGPVQSALATALDREVLAIDLPGHGAESPIRTRVGLAGLTADVAARIPDRAHVVGFSLGALVGQRLAVDAPERVASLAAVSSVCRRTPDEAAAVAARLASARDDFPTSAEASIERWYPAGTTVAAETVEETRRVLLANDVESYLYAYEVFATGDADVADELDRIRVPVLAVTGADDPGSTPDMSRRLADAVPGAIAVVVPGARHMLPVERPDALAAALIDLVRTTEGTNP